MVLDATVEFPDGGKPAGNQMERTTMDKEAGVVAVVGLGYVGLQLAAASAAAVPMRRPPCSRSTIFGSWLGMKTGWQHWV